MSILRLHQRIYATKKQQNYIEILSNDLQFTREQRNSHLSVALDREIKSLDELTLNEASKMIEYFKTMKDYQKSLES